LVERWSEAIGPAHTGSARLHVLAPSAQMVSSTDFGIRSKRSPTLSFPTRSASEGLRPSGLDAARRIAT
jgi:hypothetical protein